MISSGNDEARTSNRKCIALETLLTFCPPAPCARIAVISETVPDTAGLAKLMDLPVNTPAGDVAKIAFHQRRQNGQSEFLPLHVQRVVAISCVLREGDNFKVWSLGAPKRWKKSRWKA